MIISVRIFCPFFGTLSEELGSVQPFALRNAIRNGTGASAPLPSTGRSFRAAILSWDEGAFNGKWAREESTTAPAVHRRGFFYHKRESLYLLLSGNLVTVPP
jgi:hypothetical protein